ncbi:MAG: DUF938 domain-containing protein, partial [Pseudomonadota bacterium]
MKLDSPSFHRNINPIETLLHSLLKDSSGDWLEIGSGSGQHVARLASRLGTFNFQPSELERDRLLSINAHVQTAGVGNVAKAVRLDVTDNPW